MTLQDDIFFRSEGDAWFSRNKEGFDSPAWDYTSWLVLQLGDRRDIKSVCDLGGSNGYFLNSLREQFSAECIYYCVDGSQDAIQDGKGRYPYIHFLHGALSDVPIKDVIFDFVIVNFVLHWVDRKTLSKTISEIDRLIADGGYLLLSDFLPDFPQRRVYHHYKESKLYTYKQDYGKIFQALGLYSEIARITSNHDQPRDELEFTHSSSRSMQVLLKKSFTNFYPEP